MVTVARMGANLHVFRQGRRTVPTESLRRGLAADLDALPEGGTERARRLAEDALLRAGEVECLLADHGSPRAGAAEALTDRLADLALGTRAPVPRLPDDLTIDLPRVVRPSPPEGFVYYAVQPARFASLARDLDVPSGVAAIVGVRTIGATLSAVVAAALRLRGIQAARATARPTGHPYARMLEAAPALSAWIRAQRDRGAAFFVVDEGPGMSGSSFLAVAEAIAREGVDPRGVTLLGTRPVDPRDLLAERAAERYAALAGLRIAPPAEPPEDAGIDLSAGAWRAQVWADEARWPAVWTTHERVKRLSADGQRLYKFEGLGRWGTAVRERARIVASAGFGPAPADAGGGFASYAMLPGRPLGRLDRTREIVDRLADYCAFRAAAFPAPDADLTELTEMARRDAEAVLADPDAIVLPLERPVIADARMHPHEWIAAAEGPIQKVDAAAHGDDHIFPGPIDIAWDLAGTIVEWGLEDEVREAFLDRYARASGDRPEARLPAYLVAYLVLHMARAKMAAGALGGTTEALRMMRDWRRYRRALARASAV